MRSKATRSGRALLDHSCVVLIFLLLGGPARGQGASCDGCINSHGCQQRYDNCIALSNCQYLSGNASATCYSNCRSQFDSCTSGANNSCSQQCGTTPQRTLSLPEVFGKKVPPPSPAPTPAPRPAVPALPSGITAGSKPVQDGNYGPFSKSRWWVVGLSSGTSSDGVSYSHGAQIYLRLDRSTIRIRPSEVTFFNKVYLAGAIKKDLKGYLTPSGDLELEFVVPEPRGDTWKGVEGVLRLRHVGPQPRWVEDGGWIKYDWEGRFDRDPRQAGGYWKVTSVNPTEWVPDFIDD